MSNNWDLRLVKLWILLLLISSGIQSNNGRESRSIEISKLESQEIDNDNESSTKVVQRLIGGHIKNIPDVSSTTMSDDEFLQLESTGGGVKVQQQSTDEDDDDKKSLSQQVIEGKYGLIQKELFSKPAKALGVISYKDNVEVPKDTVQNLGGLNLNEIWLAEDHLLVLKGGIFKNAANWPPLDNYNAPRRQVKIPTNPKIPPPFPVQLQDNGPIEILGANGTSKILSPNDISRYPIEGYPPGTGPFFPPSPSPSQSNDGETPFPVLPYRYIAGNFSKGNGPLPPTIPFPNLKVPQFIGSLPPNAVFLPPPPATGQNQTYEEDDPSIYYPPPYTFYYSKNTSVVPAGPLVPGIILPPPPDFFAPLEPPSTTVAPIKNNTKIFKFPPRNVTKIHRVQIITTPSTSTEILKPIYVPDDDQPGPEKIPIHIPSEEIVDNSITTQKPVKTTKLKSIGVSVPKKTFVKPTPATYYEDQFVYNPIYKPKRIQISTTAVPLKAFFQTSPRQHIDIETNSVTADPIDYYPGRQNNLATRASPKFPPRPPSIQYYFYEEPLKTTTPRPIYISPPATSIRNQIVQIQNEIKSILTQTTPKPIYEYSFQAANYNQKTQISDEPFRPIYKYSSTPTPIYNYISSTPKPFNNVYTTNRPRYRQPTPNPIDHAYYTKHDERLLDDITKQYFTVFGQKIGGASPVVTTPLQPIISTTPRPTVEIHYGDNSQRTQPPPPPSLAFDEIVNYKNPPPINPNSEFIQLTTPHSLESDILVNSRHPRPPINPDAELIEPALVLNKAQLITNSYIQPQQRYRPRTHHHINVAAGGGGSFISFPLPGNGAHFYFLTPQIVTTQQQQQQQQQKRVLNENQRRNSGFVAYTTDPNQRLRRSRFKHRNEQIYNNKRRR